MTTQGCQRLEPFINSNLLQIFCRELLTYILYKYLTLHHSKISNPTPQFSWDLEIPPLSCAHCTVTSTIFAKRSWWSKVWSGIYALPATVFTSRDTHEITHVEHTLSVGFLQILHHGRLFFIILRGKLHFLHRLFPSLRSSKKITNSIQKCLNMTKKWSQGSK